MSLFAEYQPDHARKLAPVGLRIRSARPNDVEAVARLILERDQGSLDAHLDRTRAEITRSEREREFMLCVAETDRSVIAFGRCGLLGSESAGDGFRAPPGWYLMGLIVDPKIRRRGVGLELTRYRMRWIAKRAQHAYYFVNARNQASIDLHQKLGFRELTRDFQIPNVSFTGGAGVLFRAVLAT